jgi:hypothetical protein
MSEDLIEQIVKEVMDSDVPRDLWPMVVAALVEARLKL